MLRHRGAHQLLRGNDARCLLHRQLQPRHILQITGRERALGALHRLAQLRQGHPGLAHLLRVIEHLILRQAAAQHRHLPHTGDGKKAVAQLELCHATHLQRVGGLISSERQQHDFTRHGNDGGHFHLHILRERFPHGSQALRDNLARQINIHIPVKVHPDERQADTGGTTDIAYAGGAGKRRFDGDGDILLHFLCREAAGLRLDGDTRYLQLRENVHGQLADLPHAQR